MTTRLVTAAVAAMIAALGGVSLAACGAAGGDPGGQSDPWPAGRTFISTAVTERGVARPLVEGTRIELSFAEDGKLGARAGCNHMGGQGTIDGATLIVRDLAMTEMACGGGRDQQDSWLVGVLTGSPRLALAGDALTLTGAEVTIELTDRRVVDPDRPLAGTRWVVDTIIEGETASSVPAGAEAALEISAAGTFRATTGCAGGLLTGSAGVRAGRVAFLAVTAEPCSTGGNALDAAVRATLEGEVTYAITAGRLVLTAPGGHGLGLAAQG